MQKKIRNKFQELFSTEGSVYASPGRINLIENIPIITAVSYFQVLSTKV